MSEKATISNSAPNSRSSSIDLLRGLAMVIMALDHVRDFFGTSDMSPNLAEAPFSLFFTRWITHICAPTFFFLAGTGAYLSLPSLGLEKVRSFLLKRGLWLMLLEFTVINWAWRFTLQYNSLTMAVIWTLGLCMVGLSFAIRLPVRWVGGLGIAIVALHNIFDSVKAVDLGSFRALWLVLHERGVLWQIPDHTFRVLYPFVPWIGVMMAGYAFGALWKNASAKRVQLTFRTGSILIGAFVLLRLLNLYGDPAPWTAGANFRLTFQSFLNLQKYPPSLDFCLVTLGLAMWILALFERGSSKLFAPLNVFGRVPLFYYIAHLYLIHGLAVIWILIEHGPMASGDVFRDAPDSWGHPLNVVYGVWIFVVVALYPLCTWYARLKARSKNPWLRYL